MTNTNLLIQPELVSTIQTASPTLYTEQNKFWEVLEFDGFIKTMRGKVPGGWLVQTVMIAPADRDMSKVSGITFVSDPTHSWMFKSKFG